MKKSVNGIVIDMTADEIALRQSEELAWSNGAFDRAMENLRVERKSKLVETDYLALSDNTMSSEMTTYRQNLRDITNGLTTVEDIEAVVFPTKPEENE